ncbi:MAG: acyl-CoA dehydrogenase protein [Frankiales bacterium]|nr:acyl-CoA dehydrogenase protein [Frankiales bacterium]
MPSTAASTQDLAEFGRRAAAWLAQSAAPRSQEDAWGAGSDSVAVFHDLPHEDELALLRQVGEWQRCKYDAGFGALTWPVELGGMGLSSAYEEAFNALEVAYDVPPAHELSSVTLHLVAPTLRLFGTPHQVATHLRPLLRGDELCCQLFSEPAAGSDLSGLGTRAVRDGDDWVVTGQKVWSSGAQFAQWGELIARTDPDAVKQAGLTAFLLPLDLPGVDVRPLRQMSGGTSFCEVFLDEVRIPDSLRLGDVGAGWKVALATLGFERGHSGASSRVGGGWQQLLPLAQELQRDTDPHVRQLLADVWISEQVARLAAQRDHESRLSGDEPGPVGSLRKLHWVQGMALASEAAAAVLGPRLAADTGEWGTFAWTEHLLGAPGYRIAGGTDEIQRNIIGDRLLGLPAEPRQDRGPWRDVPR